MPWDDPRDKYRKGQFYQICDQSGFKMRSANSKREWTGRIVREEIFTPRQTQDFVRAVVPKRPQPQLSPEGDNQFITQTVTAADL